MLAVFDLAPGVDVAEFGQALADYTAHLRALDLVEGSSPIGRRYADTILDTDDERSQGFALTMTFRSCEQSDRAIAYIESGTEPGRSLHRRVYAGIENPVFTCFEEVGVGAPDPP